MFSDILKLAAPIYCSAMMSMIVLLININVIGAINSDIFYLMGLYMAINYIMIAGLESFRAFIISHFVKYQVKNDLLNLIGAAIIISSLFFIIIAVLFFQFRDSINQMMHVPMLMRYSFNSFTLSMIFATMVSCWSYIAISSLYAMKKGKAGLVLSFLMTVLMIFQAQLWAHHIKKSAYALPLSLFLSSTVLLIISLIVLRFYCGGFFSKSFNASAGIKVWREYCRFGIPVLCSYLTLFFGVLSFGMVLFPHNESMISGFGVAYRIQTCAIMPAIAIGSGISILYNQALARQDGHAAYQLFFSGLLFTFLFYMAMSCLIFFMAPLTVHYLTPSDSVTAVTLNYLNHVSPTYVFFGPFIMYLIFCEQTGLGRKGFLMNGVYFSAILTIQASIGLFRAISLINILSVVVFLPLIIRLIKGEHYVSSH